VSPPDAGHVEVSVPLRPEHAATIRTVAAALGADAGFSVDELDDLRLALSEVFSALVDDERVAEYGRARVLFFITAGTARIELRAEHEHDHTGIELDDLALGILQSVTDEFEIAPETIVLVKHATEAIADATTS
jgi:hypothetical protein